MCLHCFSTKAAAQQRVEVAKHRFAADDEDPGIHDGVEGVEAEGCQVLFVVTKWVDGINKSCDLLREKIRIRHSLQCSLLNYNKY